MKSQKGFVLIEFVIALPLILMLLYGLAETTLQIYRLAKAQAADYMLAVEAQEVLTRITEDLRAAKSFKIIPIETSDEKDIDTIIINYHGASTFYYEDNKKRFDDRKIFDVIDTRVYTVSNYKLHSKRRDTDLKSNPITGGNFFGDTVVTYLKFTNIEDKVLHITLEMESLTTNNKIRLSTAVFMPAYGK